MRGYNGEQWEALLMVQRYLEGLPDSEIERLRASVGPYLQFRSEVSQFQKKFLSEICTQACFTTRQSACCNRDGIATFFADLVINALFSSTVSHLGFVGRLPLRLIATRSGRRSSVVSFRLAL
jgi:hypothetical protein